MKLTKICPLFLLLLSLSFWLVAQEKSRVQKFTFNASADAQVEVDNKFGRVEVIITPGKTVEIEVTTKTWGRNDDKAQQLMNMITVEELKTSNRFIVSTEIQSKNTNNNDRSGFEINYIVRIPDKLSLKIENKFGAVFIPDYAGLLNLEVKFGNLDAGRLSHKGNLLDLGYSSIEIEELTNAVIDVGFCGSVEIERVGDIRIDISYSTVDIEIAETLNADLSFGQLNVDEVSNSVIVDASYSPVDISRIKASVKEVIIENSFGSVDVTFAPDAAFTYYIESKFGGVSNRIRNAKASEVYNKSNTESERGTVGNNPTMRVQVEASHGNVTLRD